MEESIEKIHQLYRKNLLLPFPFSGRLRVLSRRCWWSTLSFHYPKFDRCVDPCYQFPDWGHFKERFEAVSFRAGLIRKLFLANRRHQAHPQFGVILGSLCFMNVLFQTSAVKNYIGPLQPRRMAPHACQDFRYGLFMTLGIWCYRLKALCELHVLI